MPTVETQRFVRKQFGVDAVQVTPENIEAVAEWCGGTVMHNGDKEGHLSRDFIKVNVHMPKDEKQTQAYFGDWVLRSGRSFKVYTDSAFGKSFSRKVDA